jgi:hypothetical protein
MVLSRALHNLALIVLIASGAVFAAGCGQSLFDAHGGGRDGGGGDDDGGGDGDVPDTCAAPCIADAAADFDGSPGGKGNHWRYLDDNRNRTWTPMTAAAGSAQVGVDARNSFRRCADDPLSAACKALPGALFVTTGGRGSRAEPAIEFAAAEARTIRIAFRAHAPAGDHKIRLYRNSREDVLFTMPAAAGVTVEHQVTVDAVPGDRFLVAISADTDPGGAVALHVFVNGASATFPATCGLAVPFSVPGTMGNTVDDLCRGELRSFVNDMPGELPHLAGPYTELGDAAYFENSYYEATAPLSSSTAMTVQLWLQIESSPAPDGWVFSNIDGDTGGGLALRFAGSTSKLVVSVVQSTNPTTYASQSVPIAAATSWHFVRVVHASDAVSICVDGVKVGSGPLTGPRTSGKPVNLGRNVGDSSTYFIGETDDVRVFFEALPCD